MINLKRALNSHRMMKALTGLLPEEFEKLKLKFAAALKERCHRKEGKRAPRAGRPHTLKSVEEKLFFILFYMKCYCTYDVMAFLYDVDRSQPCRWVMEYLPVLEEALGKEMVLPKRKIKSVEEFLLLFPDGREIWIDGRERRIKSPKDERKRRERDSGKEKEHTKKNIVVTNHKKEVILLGGTNDGRKHEKKAIEEDGFMEGMAEGMVCWSDKGFQGFWKGNVGLIVIHPIKKAKGRELSEVEKEWNRYVNSRRMLVEHAIGGVKRYGIVGGIYGNRREGMEDKVMLLACGLWNFHIKMKEMKKEKWEAK